MDFGKLDRNRIRFVGLGGDCGMRFYFHQNKENLFYPNAYQSILIKTLPREGDKPPRVVIELHANKPRIVNNDLSLISHRVSDPRKLYEIADALRFHAKWLENELEKEREEAL